MNESSQCNHCGRALSGNAAEGLCPSCLLRSGMDWLGLKPVPQNTERKAQNRHRQFGDYELIEEIARGGMGVVYRARQISLNRLVAVKVLLFGRFASESFVRRFRAEAEAAASLRHPNIVGIHEIGEHDGQHYFSMELVEGCNLAERVRETPMPPRDAARCLRAVAGAIDYAHRNGVLHRDLKPSNVLLDPHDQPRVTDFGLAKRVSADGTADLTATGQVLGSPSFMPPEQADATRGTVSAASDIYSLGALLYHLLTGRPPFVAASIEETIRRVLEDDPVPLRLLNPAVPRDLETICLTCLRKQPADRYACAAALEADLDRFLRDEPIYARPAGSIERAWRWCQRKPALAALWAGLATVLLTGAAGVGWQWLRAEHNASRARIAAEEARRAESEATERLWSSLIDQARAQRRTGEAGQRHLALDAVRRAATIRPSLALRNEAIAALALPDWRFVPAWTNPYPMLTADFAPSQSRFAVASTSGRVKVIRTMDATEEIVFPSLGRWVWRVEFSADERLVLANYDGGSNVVWELASSRPLWSGHSERRSARFLGRSQHLLVDGPGRTIRCISLTNGTERWSQPMTYSGQWTIAEQPQQRWFALSWAGRAEVEMRSVETGDLIRTVNHPSPLGTITWSQDGEWLLAGVENGWIYSSRIDPDGGSDGWKAHNDAAVGLAFAPNSQCLVSCSWDRSIRLWNWPERTPMVEARGFEATRLRFDETGRSLAGVVRGKEFGRLEVSAGTGFRRIPVPLGNERGAWSIHVSPDGTIAAASYSDGVRLFDLAAGKDLLFEPMGQCRSVWFLADGQSLLTSGPHGLARWPVEPGSGPGEWRLGARESIRDGIGFHYAVVTSDGKWALAANRPAGSVAVYDLQQPTNRFALTNHPGIQHVAVSPDGRWVASGTWNGSGVRVWNFATRQLVKELPVEGSASVTFSPDGRLLVSGARQYQVWETDSWREKYRLADGTDPCSPCAFSADGRLMATVKEGRVAQLIEAATGRVLANLEAPRAVNLSGLCFTPDGNTLLALEWTRGIQVWDLRALRNELAALGLDWETQMPVIAK